MKIYPNFPLVSACLVVGCLLFSLSLPTMVQAYTDDLGDEEGMAVVISRVDSSKLSANHPIVTVEIVNTGDLSTPSAQLELSYIHFVDSESRGEWIDKNRAEYRADPISIGVFDVAALLGGERRLIQVEIPRHEVAKLKKHSALLVGTLMEADNGAVLSQQIGLYTQAQPAVVHTSLLAFDNAYYLSSNRSPQIRDTVNEIVSRSATSEEIFSVVLADDYGVNNTDIFFVYGGEWIAGDALLDGLPDPAGSLSPALTEYDMGDGETLGGYLKWVRGITGPSKLVFSFYGHGGALMPNVETAVNGDIETGGADLVESGSGPVTMPSWVAVQPSWVAVQPSWVAVQPSWVAVQPSWVAVQPSWYVSDENYVTDAHPLSLISVKDLSRALEIGSDGGRHPIEVVDLVHCFSLSVEEVYELAPYSEAVVGSANYHFFDTRMPGTALSRIEPADSSVEIAADMMHAYEVTLPQDGYPRTMAVVDSGQVSKIKTHWDATSAALMGAFERDHAATLEKLQAAYLDSTKYDSTSCDNRFSLQSPDALVDFYQFAQAVGKNFSNDMSVMTHAQATAAQIDEAVYATVNHSGSPWFATDPAERWDFSGKGLSLYADLVGVPGPSGEINLSWQSVFYNRQPHALNPSPFEFVASSNETPTWSDVLVKSWEGYSVYPQSCLITIPPDFDEVEIAALSVDLVGNRGQQPDGKGGRLIATEISLEQPLGNVVVRFEIVENGAIIYAEDVHTGWLAAGVHTITTRSTLSESMLDVTHSDKALIVTLDPDGYIIEQEKVDNQLVLEIKN